MGRVIRTVNVTSAGELQARLVRACDAQGRTSDGTRLRLADRDGTLVIQVFSASAIAPVASWPLVDCCREDVSGVNRGDAILHFDPIDERHAITIQGAAAQELQALLVGVHSLKRGAHPLMGAGAVRAHAPAGMGLGRVPAGCASREPAASPRNENVQPARARAHGTPPRRSQPRAPSSADRHDATPPRASAGRAAPAQTPPTKRRQALSPNSPLANSPAPPSPPPPARTCGKRRLSSAWAAGSGSPSGACCPDASGSPPPPRGRKQSRVKSKPTMTDDDGVGFALPGALGALDTSPARAGGVFAEGGECADAAAERARAGEHETFGGRGFGGRGGAARRVWSPSPDVDPAADQPVIPRGLNSLFERARAAPAEAGPVRSAAADAEALWTDALGGEHAQPAGAREAAAWGAHTPPARTGRHALLAIHDENVDAPGSSARRAGGFRRPFGRRLGGPADAQPGAQPCLPASGPPLPAAALDARRRGLPNEGNSCYINAVLQALASARTLRGVLASTVAQLEPLCASAEAAAAPPSFMQHAHQPASAARAGADAGGGGGGGGGVFGSAQQRTRRPLRLAKALLQLVHPAPLGADAPPGCPAPALPALDGAPCAEQSGAAVQRASVLLGNLRRALAHRSGSKLGALSSHAQEDAHEWLVLLLSALEDDFRPALLRAYEQAQLAHTPDHPARAEGARAALTPPAPTPTPTPPPPPGAEGGSASGGAAGADASAPDGALAAHCPLRRALGSQLRRSFHCARPGCPGSTHALEWSSHLSLDLGERTAHCAEGGALGDGGGGALGTPPGPGAPPAAPPASTLSQLLERYFATGRVERTCPRCACSEAAVEPSLDVPPACLLLHLKRFRPSLLDGGVAWRKCTARVGLQETLDLTRYLTAAEGERQLPPSVGAQLRAARAADVSPSARYRLSAIVRHHGRSLEAGHYTAECACPPHAPQPGATAPDAETLRAACPGLDAPDAAAVREALDACATPWLHFDDLSVTQRDAPPLELAAAGAYLLVYERLP